MRYFIKLAYNGARYYGWQIQRQGPTVQESVNNAVSAIFRQEINVVGCGRTDTGVHACEFFAHFDLPEEIPSKERERAVKKLNGFLAADIAVFDILPVTMDANARFSAKKRTYKYYISTRKDPFTTNSAYSFHTPLDSEKMNEACKALFNHHDFTSFSKVNTQTRTNNCRIMEAAWQSDGHLLIFTISADRFLRNMVRAIVGTMIDVGRKKLTLKGFEQIIQSKNRSNAGYSVPPHGLFLHAIEYPPDIFL